ncbi:putative 2OG-Fe(II) oxygenase superfamily protein [Lyophyllum shimeji]|uniref:2OG-Fe(II) oxygenase superfamily protein n=1 Tax=Lyophyllum shimeji TaxID=47721 RepID=A0A9P3UM19_LYOSH|nr:putative 2OG-Fe(II) oxygenase superfamily protein [Lyophyllum shimeji]
MVGATKRARQEVSDSEVEKVKNLEDFRLTDMPDAEVFYVPRFVDEAVAEEWYLALLELDSWYRPKLKVYGREITQSRKIAAYATEPTITLKYSGQLVDMKYEYPPLLRRIQDEVEERLGVKFNHVMLNLYEDGSVYIGNHRDNLENRVIASVSLGAPRTFIMTHDAPKHSKATSSPPTKRLRGSIPSSSPTSAEATTGSTATVHKKRWTLEPGSLVVMQGDTQKFWKHEIPKEFKVKDGRISLTFRQLVF